MQNPNVKKTRPSLSFKQQVGIYTERVLKYLFSLSIVLGKAGEIAKNNYNLGLHHLGDQNYSDAVFRFKVVTWLEPKNVMAWYNLGTSYLADEKPITAANIYRKTLSLDPKNEEAAYMLAIARGSKATEEELPKKIPLSLSLSHFNAMAKDYDTEQLETYQYNAHKLIEEAIRSHIEKGRLDHEVLDLGVGTGLCASRIRDISANITGVDFSVVMLELAMQVKSGDDKKAYDSLIEREALEYLKEAPAASYDIIIAGGLFSFIGELDELFKHISQALKPGGLLVFTADKQEKEGLRFEPSEGRFRFAKGYLQNLAHDNALKELSLEEAQLYLGPSGLLGVFQK